MATRLYLVKDKYNEKVRIVRAGSQGAALKHVVDDTLTVKLASPEAVLELIDKQGQTAIEVAAETTGNASTN